MTEAEPGQTLALQCRTKSRHWSVSAGLNWSTGLLVQCQCRLKPEHWTSSAVSVQELLGTSAGVLMGCFDF